ncbi:lipopolysaccharide biosynthesis protein [Celeribacter sp.]|uniref:lipopolysaccharide biosynthesis protein n=1 Tax=Celeribacter sp. TaxID=1890673 RepID=UPI003A9182D5
MIRRISVSMGMRVLGALSPILLSYLIIAVYETDQSSQVLNFLVLVAFTRIVLARGLPSASLRFFSAKPDRLEKYFWPTLFTLNIRSLQLSIVAFILVLVVSDLSCVGALLVVLSGHVGTNLLFGRFVAVAEKQVALSIVSEPLGISLLSAALLILVAYTGLSVRFEYLYIVAGVLVAIPVFKILKPATVNVGYGLANDDLKLSARKFYKINVSSYLVIWGTVLVAGHFLSSQHLQDLNMSVRLSSAVTLVLVSLNAVFAPDLARAFKIGERSTIIRISGTYQLWSQLSTLLFCLILLAGSDELLQFAKGADYSEYFLDPLQVVIIGQMISGLSGPCFGILNMSGNEHVQLLAIVFGVLATAMTLLFLGFHSVYSFAIATAVGVVAQNLFGVYKVYRILGINLLFIVFLKEYRYLRGTK